jgi:flagellar basal-body rod protein FlgB
MWRLDSETNMAINFNEALGTFESALKLRSHRAEILSSNLVNADTPNFKARDFDFHAALKNEMARSELKKNDAANAQQGAADGNNVGLPALQYRTPTQPSVDGNTVDEHLEHAQFMENNLAFQTAFTLLNGRLKGLMTAIRGD